MFGDQLRRRREEWIDSGAMEKLRQMVLEAYDQMIGLELSEVAPSIVLRHQGSLRWPEGGKKPAR